MKSVNELNENARKILRDEDELGTRVSGSPLARLLRERSNENARNELLTSCAEVESVA